MAPPVVKKHHRAYKLVPIDSGGVKQGGGTKQRDAPEQTKGAKKKKKSAAAAGQSRRLVNAPDWLTDGVAPPLQRKAAAIWRGVKDDVTLNPDTLEVKYANPPGRGSSILVLLDWLLTDDEDDVYDDAMPIDGLRFLRLVVRANLGRLVHPNRLKLYAIGLDRKRPIAKPSGRGKTTAAAAAGKRDKLMPPAKSAPKRGKKKPAARRPAPAAFSTV